MLFAIPYPIPYPEHHFGIGYPYPPDSLKSDMDTLKRIRGRFRRGNYPIRLHGYILASNSTCFARCGIKIEEYNLKKVISKG